MLIATLALAALAAAWFAYRRTTRVSCTLDLEATPQHFHAHVALPDSVRLAPGDEVLVHGAPARIARGTRRTMSAEATVRQASLPRRLWTRLTGGIAFHELYDVGFEG